MASQELPPGLYDDLITVALNEVIDGLGDELRPQSQALPAVDAPRRLAEHVGHVVSIVVESLGEDGRVDDGVALVHDLLAVLHHHAPDAVSDLKIAAPPGLSSRVPDGSYRTIERPLTSLHDTTLLVNAPGEPTILHELIGEIPSAHRIDVLMAFVRLSGVRPMLPALQRHVDGGGQVRLLTTTYTNSTQLEALRRSSRRVCRCGCRTTRRPRACTRSRGCSTAPAGIPRRTSARRT
jgi:hypothetical protein